MKKFQNFIIAIFSLVALFACRPSADENGYMLHGLGGSGTGTGGTTPTVIAGKVVSKIFTHSKDPDTGIWEDITTKFNYVGKQLKSIDVSGGESINIEYGANQKISKMSSTSFVATYTYNASNQVSKLSIDIAGVSKNDTTFTFDSSGKVSKINDTSNLFIPLPISLGREDTLTYSGDQVLKCLSIYNAISSGTSAPASVTATYTYDSKISPFYTLPLEYNLFIVSFAGTGTFVLSKNNSTSSTVVSDVTDASKYTYQYDAEGYAIKQINGDEYATYEYIKL